MNLDTLAFVSVLVLLCLGLLIRMTAIAFEARHLRYAWDFLSRPGDEEERNGKRETLFQRIGVALRAARLGRILSLLILGPTAYLLVLLLKPTGWPFIDGGGFWAEAWSLLLVAIGLTALSATFQATVLRSFYDILPENNRRRRASWLSEDSDPIPAPAAATAILWDWLIRMVELLTKRFDIERPKAYFFEVDDELLMAVGEEELGAFGLRSHDDEEDPLTEDQRTEREMVRAIQRLDMTLVREVMRPLNKVTAIHLQNFSAEKFLAIARRTGYTRFPCYYDQMTNLIGYLNVHDFLDSPVLPRDLRSLVHDVVFIPEVARVDEALQEMLRKKNQIAICFDEFGGCSGLLSREDIIEEITGEVMDEYDRPEELKWETRRNDFLVDASIDLDDLEESIGLELEKRNCDTLAGYIYHRLSRVPRRGEVIEEHGWLLEIVHMDKHRLQKVRIVPPPEEREKKSGNGVSPGAVGMMF